MWWVIILLSLIILLIIFLLLTPIVFEVDSDAGQFEVRITGIARANVILKEQLWLQLWVLGFTFRIDPLKPAKRKTHHELKKKKEGARFSLKSMATKSRMLIRTFHVRKFYCDLDSGNFLLNSWLYPAFHFIDPAHHHWNVNFNGRTSVALTIENNLLRIMRILLK